MASTYTHRGIYGTDGHSHVGIQAPTISTTRCTTIFMSENTMHEQSFEIRCAIASFHVQFIAIRGVVLIL